MASPPIQPYHGDFVAWNGGCVLIGEGGGGPIEPHAHYAIQLCVGVPSGVRVRFGRQGSWQACAGALVPSRAAAPPDQRGQGDTRAQLDMLVIERGKGEGARPGGTAHGR